MFKLKINRSSWLFRMLGLSRGEPRSMVDEYQPKASRNASLHKDAMLATATRGNKRRPAPV